MELTDFQRDALTELINIAFSRTAASLSDLTGNRVELDVPEVSIHPMGELSGALSRHVQGEVATVHQIFSGPIAGDAMLLLSHDGALQLIELLMGADAPAQRMAASSREVLNEIGNILLNSCLGIFGDLLKIRFSFTVPRLHLESLSDMLESLVIGQDELRYALLIGAHFQVQKSKITGSLLIVLGIASLEHLMSAVEKWAQMAMPLPMDRDDAK